MKKLVTICLLLLAGFTGFTQQSSLPNGNFEGWVWTYHPTHAGGGFYEPMGGFFKSLNILDTIPTPPGLTVYPCDTANTVHGGTKSARVVTKKIELLNVVIPGVIGTLEISWSTFSAILGEPYTWDTKPANFQGYYQSFPLNGDSAAAVLLLSKWNSASHKRDTLAYNREVFHGTVNQWTYFDVPVNYLDQTTMPDSITVLLLSCAGFNAANMMGSVGTVGSTALFDDVTLTNITGIPMLMMPEVSVKISPNPVTDVANVTLDKVVKNGVFEIYNSQGKLMQAQPLGSLANHIYVGSLSSGMYYYKVTDGKNPLNTGTFLVTR
jgi:hypothetical protein